jgi:hypothetical protein
LRQPGGQGTRSSCDGWGSPFPVPLPREVVVIVCFSMYFRLSLARLSLGGTVPPP